MESLNISSLNLSSVKDDDSKRVLKLEIPIPTDNRLSDVDDEYHWEYREDIWENLLEQESERTPIHLQSPQLEFRGTLVQQLREVTKKLGLSIATLHSAVAQLDLFMDAHRLRSDRLTHVALACLSLAAKSEEKFSRAPTLKTLAKISGVKLCGKTFRQLEWMVGQHVRWRILAPTPVTYASLIAQFVITDKDLTTRHPKFVRRYKRDGAKLLEAYLELTLSDVRLRVMESVDVGCACVSCARAGMGVTPWPEWLEAITGRNADQVAPIARLLNKMMEVLKSRESTVDNDVDQGYSSARTSPNQTPTTSPRLPDSHDTSSNSSSTSSVDTSYRNQAIRHPNNAYSVLDLEDSTLVPNNSELYRLPMDTSTNRINANDPNYYNFMRTRRLLDDSLGTSKPSTSMAVKRNHFDSNLELDRKRMRVLNHMSQVAL